MTKKRRKRKTVPDLTGQKFGRWTVLYRTNNRKILSSAYERIYWYCKCVCGKEKEIYHYNLLASRSSSCGCISADWNKAHTRENSSSWKGGYRLEDGYALVYKPEHPKAKKNGYVREHTVVMETKIGRPLLPTEQVHHINGIKHDNRPENLELWSRSQPTGKRVEDMLKWAKEVLTTYE